MNITNGRQFADDPILGAPPALFWGTDAVDGAAGAWLEAQIGSLYVRKLASNVAVYIKVAAAGATADWAVYGASTALLTQAELDFLDGATAGTVVASKAVVVDANKDVGTFRHVTISGNLVTGATTLSETDLAKIDGITNGTQAANKAVVADANVNQGIAKVTALHIGTSGSETQVTSSGAELNYLDITTLGTGAASKAVVLDAGDDYIWPVTGIMTYGVLKDPAATTLGATAAELNNAADVSARTQELTVSGAVTAGVQSVELNHATVVIAATIANANAHQGLFVVKDTSATGTAAHTLTLTAGTFNGTNNVATLNARDECLVIYFDSTGRGTVVVNIGAVALS